MGNLLARRREMLGMSAEEKNTIELYPVDQVDRRLFCVQTSVTVGQKITVAWKTDALYTNRYFLRTLTATLDGGPQYQIYAPSVYGLSGELTQIVTTAGNILIGGYNVGYNDNGGFVGDYIKVKIENPTE